jgi:Zn finger protein HypA/HybF involved in hydrogenase expression
MFGYIYILKLREHINCNEIVYKIGRTHDILKRIRSYPKGSKLLYIIYSNNIITQERDIIQKLKPFLRGDLGYEYFACPIKYIKDTIDTISGICDYKKNEKDNIIFNSNVKFNKPIKKNNNSIKINAPIKNILKINKTNLNVVDNNFVKLKATIKENKTNLNVDNLETNNNDNVDNLEINNCNNNDNLEVNNGNDNLEVNNGNDNLEITKNNKYMCPRCNYETLYVSNFITHLNRKTICKDINESTLSPKTILENLLIKKNNKQFECDKCNTKFTTNSSLKRHHTTCNGINRSNNTIINGLKNLLLGS